jgi:hypothetical protein
LSSKIFQLLFSGEMAARNRSRIKFGSMPGLGWFTAALIGELMPPSFDGLGVGVLMALLLYFLAFVFGIAGFVLCMVLLSKRRPLAPK